MAERAAANEKTTTFARKFKIITEVLSNDDQQNFNPY